MDILATFNDWIRLLILMSGVFIGGFTVGLAKKKWKEVLGVVTLLCSIVVPVLAEINMCSVRNHSMYDSDWDIIKVWFSDFSFTPETIVLFLYIVPFVLWIVCLSQIIRIVLANRRSR